VGRTVHLLITDFHLREDEPLQNLLMAFSGEQGSAYVRFNGGAYKELRLLGCV
jgi:hypothetical protein